MVSVVGNYRMIVIHGLCCRPADLRGVRVLTGFAFFVGLVHFMTIPLQLDLFGNSAQLLVMGSMTFLQGEQWDSMQFSKKKKDEKTIRLFMNSDSAYKGIGQTLFLK